MSAGKRERSIPSGGKSKMVAFRVDEAKLDEIDRRAADFNLTRTDYLIRCALDDLPSSRTELVEWQRDVEQRLRSLERFVELGGIG